MSKAANKLSSLSDKDLETVEKVFIWVYSGFNIDVSIEIVGLIHI
jgi:hypothetical protein